ncbi:MAG: ribonuclease BN [Sulfolobus sp.]|jgi:tRNA-intron endonuclease|nr:ribonuclease BN [Sulfolobaceae archaeon]
MSESFNIDEFIVINDLKYRGKKSKSSGGYIFVTNNNENYVIMILNENKPLSIKKIEDFVSFTSKIEKRGVIAIVDKYGDVTYYSISEIKLNKR